MTRGQHENDGEDQEPASPVGTDTSTAQRRRRNRSVEYRRIDEQFAATRELAAQVILFRTRQRLTQEQLADLMETSAPHISRIESGRYMPSGTTLQRFAEVFKRPLHITFGDLPNWEPAGTYTKIISGTERVPAPVSPRPLTLFHTARF